MDRAPHRQCTLLVAVAAVVACSTNAQVSDESVAAQFRGQRYPAPEPLPPGEVQPPPSEPELVDLPPPLSHLTPEERALAEQVRNAATRDLETERLVRRYMAFVRAMVDAAGSRSAPTYADTYDPLPLLRLHAGLLHELERVVHTAAALQGRFHDISEQQAVDLAGKLDESGRAGRLRQLYRMCGCIRRDAEERVGQGHAFIGQQRAGTSDADLRRTLAGPQQFAQDMAMLTRTIDCSRFVVRSFPPDR